MTSANHRRPRPPQRLSRVDDPVLSVNDLAIEMRSRLGVGHAVSGVSFSVQRGETLGLVGESGSGKSLTASAILQLLPKPIATVASGTIEFNGSDLLTKSAREMRKIRGRHISMVLQDPLSALNPVFTIGSQLRESIRLHTYAQRRGAHRPRRRAARTDEDPTASRTAERYPHQFSGGMRQRVVGAIAIAAEPELLIADEPTTALDVTVQAAYLELLKELNQRTRMSMLFITHDFGVVRSVCDRVAVMYAGRLAEVASTRAIFSTPRHPVYPRPDRRRARHPQADRQAGDDQRLASVDLRPAVWVPLSAALLAVPPARRTRAVPRRGARTRARRRGFGHEGRLPLHWGSSQAFTGAVLTPREV